MSKLFGAVFILAVAVGCFFTFPRTQTNATVREIPVASNAISEDRSPASVGSPVHFQINETALNELEKRREHLREFASAEPTAGGWTIHIRPGDQVFSKTGVRDGDQISLIELRAQAESAREPVLADRFVDILRQIEN
jgi:hypothetical protein